MENIEKMDKISDVYSQNIRNITCHGIVKKPQLEKAIILNKSLTHCRNETQSIE